MKLLGITIVSILLVIFYTFLGGVIIKDFWEWFILPVFTFMPALTIKTAAGLSFVVGYMCKYHKIFETKEEKERDWRAKLIVGLTVPFGVWGVGYLLHLWVG